MPLTAGDKVGPYEIVALIGKGGMGEVYRARDPRLGRDVAIKISAARFSERFEREARAIAALNHPNICTLYDIGPNYLVMEYIEGESPKGPLPLEEALRIARQIADALEAAHEKLKPIIHRDLKPANIKIKPDGLVKVLDFGLAKMHEPPGEDGDTVPMGLTEAGTILGTPAYMSPEQALGTPADKRADIWAFGVVLYELLTGERLFKGRDMGEILVAVVKEEPSLDKVPAKVRRLLKSCLEKDPRQRLQAIGDWRLLLEDAPPPAAQTAPSPSRLGWVAAVVVLALALAALAFVHFREKPAAAPNPVRFQIPVGVAARNVEFEVSPDGRKLAFIAQGAADGMSRVWIRSLDSLEAHPLPGTESAVFLPIFWSPDSRYIGFGTRNKLMKIDIAGGPAQTVCDVFDGNPVGGSWNRDGTIIFGTNAGRRSIMRVSAGGGTASPLTTLDDSRSEITHNQPVFLPDGRHFIYLRRSRTPEYGGVYIGSLDAKPEAQSLNRLAPTGSSPEYSPSPGGGVGWLLFLRDGTLVAQPFDRTRLELADEPIPVAEQVGTFIDRSFFSASENGVLVYRNAVRAVDLQLTWQDRNGKTLGTVGEPGLYAVLSPDGKKAVVTREESNALNHDLWMLDLARGGASRFTFAPLRNDYPVWSPDGSRIIFTSNREGPANLYEKPADGSKDEELVLKSAENKIPTSWSRDGRFLLYTAADPKTKNDLWVLPDPGTPGSQPKPFLRTEFNEVQGAFSPDGRWVAYVSDESGRNEVYVRGFPAGGKWLVSQGGGSKPEWRTDGKELFYSAPEGTEMSVDVIAGAAFQAGAPKPIFRLPPGATALAIDGDGQRILVSTPTGEQATQPPFTVILNWQAGLRR